MQPYTDCTALSAGWAWNTPLWDRVGTGYVYSSKFITQEDAQIEFKNYLADRYSEERIKGLEYSHIPFKAGRYKKAWVGNCASLVLSSGFIEPLESTGLALTAFQIGTLISSLVGGNSFTNLSRYRFNLEVDTAMSEVHEFVLVHYVNTNRDDSPYWKYISNTLDIPSTIGRERKHQSFWFPLKSWECIELGFEISGIFTDSLAHNKHKLEDEDFDKATALCNVNNTLRGLKGHTKSSTESFNSHYQYLKERVYAKR
jgi:tryptophan halogenase